MGKQQSLRIGWIGTGVMGSAMCGHLLGAGYQIAVHNRSKGKAKSLLSRGAVWCETPAGVASAADVVFVIVGTPADVRHVTFGDAGVFSEPRAGSLLIDMTTSEPALARELAERGGSHQVDVLDAPVSGGDVGARAATLAVMVGGSAAGFARAQPLLELLGTKVVHMGPAGAGQQTKLANQIAIASGIVGVCEALVYARRAGLDVGRVIDTIAGGAAGSWSLTNYGPRMLHGDFAPGFRIEHFVKDLAIALGDADKVGVPLRGTALAEDLYVRMSEEGMGDRGIQALVLQLAELAGLPWQDPPVAGSR